MSKKELVRTIKVTCGVLLTLCVLYLVFYLFVLRPIPFSETGWKKAREERRYDICYRMTPTLRAKISNEAMSLNDLITLLGEPDNRRGIEVRWHLKKSDEPIFPDDWWLVVFLESRDPNQKVHFVAQVYAG